MKMQRTIKDYMEFIRGSVFTYDDLQYLSILPCYNNKIYEFLELKQGCIITPDDISHVESLCDPSPLELAISEFIKQEEDDFICSCLTECEDFLSAMDQDFQDLNVNVPSTTTDTRWLRQQVVWDQYTPFVYIPVAAPFAADYAQINWGTDIINHRNAFGSYNDSTT